MSDNPRKIGNFSATILSTMLGSPKKKVIFYPSQYISHITFNFSF